MASRGQGRAGGRGNQDREDRGKRPMVDPDPIREPVEETFEEGELTPIIMAQATVHPRPVDVGEGSSGRKTKRKRCNKESYQAAKARTTNNHYIRHAWFTWFAENVEHRPHEMKIADVRTGNLKRDPFDEIPSPLDDEDDEEDEADDRNQKQRPPTLEEDEPETANQNQKQAATAHEIKEGPADDTPNVLQ
ncbi:hypothetical protein R1sor_017348 [Riccia sorocarpa]|uniref:Uncharacterized protein n=1 Tax=Riccia sorocarpa TaxID=122646 RepID=A0ABD3IAL8_9MARC